MCEVSRSREKLFSMIVEQSPITIDEIISYKKEHDLWLGLGVDIIDFLLSKQVIGVIKVDFKENLVRLNQE